MAQLSDDCFAFGGELMTMDAALALLVARTRPIAAQEWAPLAAATGRILAEDLVAAVDVPPYDNAAVDGFAVHFADLAPAAPTRLALGGRAAAGHPLERPARAGEAIRVFTGAPLPAGQDTVLMQEDCGLEGDHVVLPPGIRQGANRRRAGEDVRAGTVALRLGTRLRPQEIGLAAALGQTRLPVYRRLRVALFSTGDEVREPGTPLAPGTLYDSNRYTIAALLTGLGATVTDLGILPDRLEAVQASLAAAATGHDALFTTGGVSTGDADHVRAAVAALGQLHFWRLAIRPGRPLALGQVGRVPFLGLPGNPVAAMVTFLRFARPLLLRLGGATAIEPVHYRVRADFTYAKAKRRREWLRGILARGEGGELVVRKFPRDGAGILSSLVAADGLVELPEEPIDVTVGSMVDFLPFSGVC